MGLALTRNPRTPGVRVLTGRLSPAERHGGAELLSALGQLPEQHHGRVRHPAAGRPAAGRDPLLGGPPTEGPPRGAGRLQPLLQGRPQCESDWYSGRRGWRWVSDRCTVDCFIMH